MADGMLRYFFAAAPTLDDLVFPALVGSEVEWMKGIVDHWRMVIESIDQMRGAIAMNSKTISEGN
jgi:hypothetical protein